jgi:hypothetical protein
VSTPFTRVVAASVYQRNMNELAKSKAKAKANDYLDNEVKLFNPGRANLNKISAWHNKISSFHDKSVKYRENINGLISQLGYSVFSHNNTLYHNIYFNQPLYLPNLSSMVATCQKLSNKQRHNPVPSSTRQHPLAMKALWLYMKNDFPR